jgi:hypothetical protein
VRPVIEVIAGRDGDFLVCERPVSEVSDSGAVRERDILLAGLAQPAVEDAVLLPDALGEPDII